MLTVLISQRLFPILPDKSPADYNLTDVVDILGTGILILTTLASIIAVIYILIGGIKYATAYGNPEAMEEAKKTLFWAIIGLVIAVACFLIVRFVWFQLTGSNEPTVPITSP